ncbi:MAG: site-specific integrase, partial [Hydrogenophilaceae bacterium]
MAATAFADFLDHLRARNYSARTIEAYGEDLRHLAELAGATPLPRLAPHDIRRFLAVMHGRGYAAGSLARILSGWRAYYRYLARRG